jgi:hypothetical protein
VPHRSKNGETITSVRESQSKELTPLEKRAAAITKANKATRTIAVEEKLSSVVAFREDGEMAVVEPPVIDKQLTSTWRVVALWLAMIAAFVISFNVSQDMGTLHRKWDVTHECVVVGGVFSIIYFLWAYFTLPSEDEMPALFSPVLFATQLRRAGVDVELYFFICSKLPRLEAGPIGAAERGQIGYHLSSYVRDNRPGYKEFDVWMQRELIIYYLTLFGSAINIRASQDQVNMMGPAMPHLNA